MAIHTKLPIYKVTYDLLDVVTEITSHMRRDFKASIGARISDECVALLVLVYRANVARDKLQHLEDLLERVQVAELLLRLSKDKRLISVAQYARAIQLTDSIGKQANGWRKASAASPVA
jgi:hypothetical protein